MKLKQLGRGFYVSLVYLLLYLPIAVVVLFSFNNTNRALAWNGFTLKWYHDLLSDAGLIEVAWHSVLLGIATATAAAILGTIIAVTLFRYKFFGRKLLHGINFMLVLLPEIVIAVAMLLFYNFLNIQLGFNSLLLAHTSLCVPFVVVTVHSSLADIDRSIFEAARDLGASDYTIFTRILVPLLMPAIMAGWLLSFTLSLDNIIISYFVSGPSFDILPLKIFAMVKLGVKPEVNALCSIMLLLTFITIFIGYRHFFTKRNHA